MKQKDLNSLPNIDKYFPCCYIHFMNLLINQHLAERRCIPLDDRFEKLTTGVARIHKSVQKIKKYYMGTLGLKGTHVMCIYFLATHPDGLTASDLCSLCQEDKAGISRILADLEKNKHLDYITSSDTKKYRAKAVLTDRGLQCAEKVNLLINEAVDKASQNITPEDRAIFYRTLFTIANNLQNICTNLDSHSKEN